MVNQVEEKEEKYTWSEIYIDYIRHSNYNGILSYFNIQPLNTRISILHY